MFHPYEIAVCGYSGSGKTTLIARLLERFASDYRVGYVKHSGHDFEVDHEGKDTARATRAGAVRVCITNDRKTAMMTGEALDFVQQRAAFDDCDFVLAEGWKQTPLPRILVLADAADVPQAQADGAGPVLAHVVQKTAVLIDGVPCLQRDDIAGIATLILDYFLGKAAALKGLVLAGGRSTRMKQDKASLEYGGHTQLENAFALVSAFCSETFVSCRSEQAALALFRDFPQVHDRYLDCGPAGGILSAMATDPEAAWLVLACDLPFADRDTVGGLLRKRQPFKIATAYRSAHDGFPEPLCAIYEPRARSRFLQFMAVGYQCPRKMLINSNAALLDLQNKRALDNVNHPEEYDAALEALNG